MPNPLTHIWRIFGSIAFSVGIIALLWHWVGGFEEQSQFSLKTLWTELSLGIVSIYLFTTLAQAFFRALRYRLLIGAHQPEDLPGVGHIYLVTLIRNMLVDMLPARLGELSYIAMMNRRYRVNAGACVASLTVSFVFDLIALMVLVVGLLFFQQFQSHLVGRLPVAIVALALVSAGAVVFIYPLFRIVAPKVSRWMLANKATGPWGRIGKLIELINEALQSTARTGILLKTLGYSLLVRGFKYSGLYVLFLAVASASMPTGTAPD
ncbi:MAG: lysylphosphatidylglycerol synthase transmembrane domain-containing protein, partial [Desulfobacterales bacterium]